MTRQQTVFRIVVGLDFSVHGHHALEHAFRVTRIHATSELHVVHAVTREDLAQADGIQRVERQEDALHHLPRKVWDRIDHVAHGMGLEMDPIRIFAHVRLGSPAAALLQVAVDYDADLVMVGTHDRKGLSRFVTGSVADEVARRATCPVMLVRPKDHSSFAKSDRVEPPRADPDALDEGRASHVYVGEEVRGWASGKPTGVRIV